MRGRVWGCSFPCPGSPGPLGDILFAVGWLAILAVVALWVTAVRTMTRAKTTLNPNGEPSHLVTSGPFAVTRNPLYLANTLLMIGVGLVSGIAWFILLAFIAAFATQKAGHRIRGEDAFHEIRQEIQGLRKES